MVFQFTKGSWLGMINRGGNNAEDLIKKSCMEEVSKEKGIDISNLEAIIQENDKFVNLIIKEKTKA